MPFWLILVMVLGAVFVLLSWRRSRRRSQERGSGEWGDGSHNVGERWRTGGYADWGGGGQ
jgi:hypothetical protein